MSSLRLDQITVPTAPLGEVNPLPPLGDLRRKVTDVGAGIPAEMRERIAYGGVRNVYPYLTQDGYSREREPRQLRVAVLDNDVLRATFLLDYGGRLWSLVHLPTGRELLFRNQVLQPANLALRNAWFSGGVEWNLGTTGHAVTTCAPLHAVRVERPDGVPVLRMYEWDRVRALGFQVDAWLPDGSSLLHVHVRIRNPNTVDVPVYWWSNTAVPESDDVRVLAPADAAFHLGYDGTLRRVPMPEHDGVDRTYTTRNAGAADHFFDLAPDVRPWIAALDGSGAGLVQTSTARLRGRKLFNWGTLQGSRHWQEWLNGPGARYLEIQAGLAATQLEHLRMPAGTEWSWLELYGPAQADARIVHGDDWAAATAEVARVVEEIAPLAVVLEVAAEADAVADTAPAEMLHRGSGWGALERRRREAAGEPASSWRGMPFTDDHLGAEQQPWLALLDNGALPDAHPAEPPVSYVLGDDWEHRLAAAPRTWLTCLHLGLLAHTRRDVEDARRWYEASLALERTPWALRALGQLDLASDPVVAAERYVEAHASRPDLLPLAVETGAALLAADRPRDALAMVDSLPAGVRDHGRVLVLEVRAALAAGDTDRAGAVLDRDVVAADVREGETALGQLWEQHQRAVGSTDPVPYRYDFRMRATPPEG